MKKEINITQLNQLLKDLDKVLKINSGGCCYIAYIIAKNLEKYKIPFKVILMDDTLKEPSYYFQGIKNRELSVIDYGFAHVCIKVYSKVINPYRFRMDSRTIELDSKDLLWLYRRGDWNEMYDTTNNNILIRFLNKICKKLIRQFQLKRVTALNAKMKHGIHQLIMAIVAIFVTRGKRNRRMDSSKW